MGILWTIFKAIFSPPRLPDTPIPDDWPPDGSLHFIPCGSSTQKTVPHTYIQYQFTSNVGEDDRRIPELGMEIMKRFCESRQVLTGIYSSEEPSKKEKYPPERFPVRYGRFLEHIGYSASIDAPDEKTLFIMERGFNATAFWASRDISAVDGCFFDFYVLPECPHIPDAKSAAETVANGQYGVWFELSEWGPCALYVTLNPETVDVAALQEIIATVCKENNILLQNPPGY